MSLASRLDRWRDYPFAVAGPVAVAYNVGVAICGGICAVLFPRSVQFWIAAVGVVATYAFFDSRRRAFARQRGITRLPPLIKRSRSSLAVTVLIGVGGFELVHVSGWGEAWTFVVYAVLWTLFDLYVRAKWTAAGRPGDPRWQRSWVPES